MKLRIPGKALVKIEKVLHFYFFDKYEFINYLSNSKKNSLFHNNNCDIITKHSQKLNLTVLQVFKPIKLGSLRYLFFGLSYLFYSILST